MFFKTLYMYSEKCTFYHNGTVNRLIIGSTMTTICVDRVKTVLPEIKWFFRNGILGNYFQQDGPSPHYVLAARKYLDTRFPGQWNRKRGPIEWPVKSPDLNLNHEKRTVKLVFFVFYHVILQCGWSFVEITSKKFVSRETTIRV